METSEMESFFHSLGDEVQDVDEGEQAASISIHQDHIGDRPSIEVFNLFTHSNSFQDLGMVDAQAEELEICVCGRDFTIKQSPGVLQSKRAGGTTAAAVWRVCVHFCEWLASSTNPLFHQGLLDHDGVVIELGSGISGLVPSVLSLRCGRVLATDQQYALKLLQDNIAANQPMLKKGSKSIGSRSTPNNIEVLSLDWEEDDVSGFLRSQSLENGVDAIIVCDCVFNYALVQPLVQTCTEICQARLRNETPDQRPTKPTLCIIAQQLRQPDVFESWLRVFMASFRVWRLPNDLLTHALYETNSYVVHVGVLRKTAK
jgi:hypothetical protein